MLGPDSYNPAVHRDRRVVGHLFKVSPSDAASDASNQFPRQDCTMRIMGMPCTEASHIGRWVKGSRPEVMHSGKGWLECKTRVKAVSWASAGLAWCSVRHTWRLPAHRARHPGWARRGVASSSMKTHCSGAILAHVPSLCMCMLPNCHHPLLFTTLHFFVIIRSHGNARSSSLEGLRASASASGSFTPGPTSRNRHSSVLRSNTAAHAYQL